MHHVVDIGRVRILHRYNSLIRRYENSQPIEALVNENIAETNRMEHLQATRRTSTDALPTSARRCIIPISVGVSSSKPPEVQRVQRVAFAKSIHVFDVDEADVEHRKGPWMRAAADRHRFCRRICIMESVIGPVLTNAHRSISHLFKCAYD